MPNKDRILSRSLKLIRDSSGRQTIVSVIILILRSLLPLAVLFLIKHYVDGITGVAGGVAGGPMAVAALGVAQGAAQGVLPGAGPGPVAGGITPAVIMLVVALIAALLADDILSAWGGYISKKQAFLLEKHIASLIHRRSATLGLIYFEDPVHHDLLSRAVRDISWRPAGLVSDIMLLFRGAVSFVAMAAVLSKFSIVALGVLVLAFIPVLWIRIKSSGRLYKVRKKVTPLSREASYFSWLMTGERPAREVKLFGLGNFFERQYRENFSESGEEELAIVRKNSSEETVASVMKMLIFGGILVYATVSFTDSRITAGEMAMYLVAFRQAMVYLRDAVSGVSGLAENRLFLRDLFLFLDLEEDKKPGSIPASSTAVSPAATTEDSSAASSPAASAAASAQVIPGFDSIEVRNLTFTYPGSADPALKNVSLRINRGEKVAIVGPNGSGKTTLVKLLCGLYDPDSGFVLLGGTDATLLEKSAYRKHFSVVFQDFMLYYLTAAENIKLGDTSSTDREERLMEAAAKAGIANFLEKLPEGYDTMLGHHTEGGRELSWGEWQKIAIARALYRDAPVLILDEPSSSLDADSEYEIFSRLGEIAAGRTCILISHRLANVRDADRIVVFDRGVVAETGTHDELMAAGGRYYSMFTRQKSLYI